jgi:hypothetical protein
MAGQISLAMTPIARVRIFAAPQMNQQQYSGTALPLDLPRGVA